MQPSWRLLPNIRLRSAAGKRDPRIAAFIEECARGGVMEAELATQEKKGMATGLHALHPLTGAAC